MRFSFQPLLQPIAIRARRLAAWLVAQPPRRLLPVAGSVLAVLMVEALIVSPGRWMLFIGFLLATVLFTSLALSNMTLLVRGWWHTVFTPALLVITTSALVLFLASSAGRQGTVLLMVVLLVLFWENLWRYYWDREHYHESSLENASLAMNTVVVWFTALLFSYLLLDPTILPPTISPYIFPLSALSMVLTVFVIDYRTLWVQRYDARRVWLMLVAQSLVIGELFWVANFLPNRVEVRAFVVVLAYYLCTNLGRSHLDGTLSPRVLRRYAYVSGLSLLFVLLTATWTI